MTVNLQEVCSSFETLWPLSGAEAWDSVGLVCGNPKQSISRVLLCVDITDQTIQEAIDYGCELILSHHPLLFQPVNFLAEDSLKGSLVSKAIRGQIAIYSAHTNADIVESGVSEVFAQKLGLTNLKPLIPDASNHQIGHGRFGILPRALSLAELASLVNEALTSTSAPVRVAGVASAIVSTVAVLGGAGDSFIYEALQSDVDCFITSDLRHHVVLDAICEIRSRPMNIIDVSHFGAESLWLGVAAAQLTKANSNVEFMVSKVNTDPWSFSLPGKTTG